MSMPSRQVAQNSKSNKLESTSLTKTKGVFGWPFATAFAFAKAKSQPKGLNALGAFAQKQLSS
jgi:hypothetical protein